MNHSPNDPNMRSSNSDRHDSYAVERGALSAEGIRRTERVAAELFALRKASDEYVALSLLAFFVPIFVR